MKNDNIKLSIISKTHKAKCKFKAEQHGPLKIEVGAGPVSQRGLRPGVSLVRT